MVFFGVLLYSFHEFEPRINSLLLLKLKQPITRPRSEIKLQEKEIQQNLLMVDGQPELVRTDFLPWLDSKHLLFAPPDKR
jgi:hypothetical protein